MHLGPPSNPFAYVCELNNTRCRDDCDYGLLICALPPPSLAVEGLELKFTVTAGGTSVTSTFYYSYVLQPVVTNVLGCANTTTNIGTRTPARSFPDSVVWHSLLDAACD